MKLLTVLKIKHWSRAHLATLTFYAACAVRATILVFLVLAGNSALFRFYTCAVRVTIFSTGRKLCSVLILHTCRPLNNHGATVRLTVSAVIISHGLLFVSTTDLPSHTAGGF